MSLSDAAGSTDGRDLVEMAEKVGNFSEAMLFELTANEHKGGWEGLHAAILAEEVVYHLWKLIVAAVDASGQPERVREYAADVANLALMIADNYGGLDVQSEAVPYRVRDDIESYPDWLQGVVDTIRQGQIARRGGKGVGKY